MQFHIALKQAFALYAVILTFLFGFYVMGLIIGEGARNQEASGSTQSAPPTRDLKDLKNQLEFLEELDDPQPGTPGSEVETLVEDGSDADTTPPPPSSPPTSPSPTYVVQAGALRTEEEAHQLRIRLEAQGFQVRLIPPNTIPGDTYYRVWVGDEFSSAEEAQELEAELEAKGIPYYTKRLN